jgi:tetratricopeptide (TPR) repeat protein
LLFSLQDPLIATSDYTSSAVEQVALKARELCRELGDSPELFAALGRLGSIHYERRELKTALELAQQMLRIAQRVGDPALRMWAHYYLGFVLGALGEFQLSRQHLELSVALYDRARGGSYGFVQDPGPTALLILGFILHRLGYPDRSPKCLGRHSIGSRPVPSLYTRMGADARDPYLDGARR